MTPFTYQRAGSIDQALQATGATFLAGGTNLVDLMKENVTRPDRLIDISGLPLKGIEALPAGGLRLGALATNADTAWHPSVETHYPLLASAILAGASPQLRNAATNGGNLLQRTRCLYFYDTAAPCNKRQPQSGCGALGGLNRNLAILGASDQCIATHPSDMCVALRALDAMINVQGAQGTRIIPIADFHRLPGADPSKDSTLRADELVTSIDLPPDTFRTHYTYLKLRDRLSYAFALVSVAVAMKIVDGALTDVRVALGGVAHKPWRVENAEKELLGRAPDTGAFKSFAEKVLEGAVGQGQNDFKIELAKRAIVRALGQAAAGIPQSQIRKSVA
jgi:xanthine dehydrogenase YagS FAD-binding subunit